MEIGHCFFGDQNVKMVTLDVTFLDLCRMTKASQETA